MTKKLSNAGLVVAAAASSAIVFGAAPANAACTTTALISSGQNCSVFDPSSSATTVTFGAYNDGGFLASTQINSIRFRTDEASPGWTFSPTPITITNIEYSLNGGTSFITTGINTSVTLPSGGTSGELISNTADFVGLTFNTDTFQFRFTLPTVTTSNNGFVSTKILASQAGGANPQTQTRSLQSTTTSSPATGTPSPLPLLGAGAAFGFSRKVRRRISSAV